MLPAGASTRGRSPTVRLLAGLAITLSAVGLYSGYTVIQLRGLEHLQGAIIDRNRADSLLLLRIQNNLNSLGLAMRDMLDGSEPYPLTAWQAQFRRIRTDLEDALARETRYAPLDRDAEQSKYLAASMTQFWDALDRIFGLAQIRAHGIGILRQAPSRALEHASDRGQDLSEIVMQLAGNGSKGILLHGNKLPGQFAAAR